jgi:hypothetical protein
MRSMRTITHAALALALSGCGGIGFDSPDQVKTLRVLAVQKTPPYPSPGEKITLRMLYWDGKAEEGAPRDVQILFSDCVNPPADLYYGCFQGEPNLSVPEPPPTEPSAGGVDHLIVHTFTVPEQIVSSRAPPPAGTPAYGLAYVLFGVCAGTLQKASSSGNNAPPIACAGADGSPRGVDDFDPGYTSIYAYADRRTNANPVVNGATLRNSGGVVEPDANGVRHVARCTNEPCPSFDFRLDIDPASAERDPGAVGLNGEPVSEQLWVSYYKTGGGLSKAQRLVNDATRGWNDDHGTSWAAPPVAGMFRLWGIVHDNRGGVEWKEAKISVE